jgi:signal transduction histidine kinase
MADYGVGNLADVGIWAPATEAVPDQFWHRKILAGRRANPARSDEVTISFTVAEALHLGVGDILRVSLLTKTRDLVPVSLRVVGIDAAPAEFPPQAGTGSDIVWATPAFYRAHQGDVEVYPSVALRLQHGAADLPAVQQEITRLANGKVVKGYPLGPQAANTQRSIHLQAVTLWLVCGLLAVIGLLVLGQLLARLSFHDGVEYRTLLAPGMSRRALFAVGLGRAAAVGAAGGALGALLAVLASPALPVGLAGVAEPHPGIHADGTVLAVGVVGAVLATMAGAAWPAWRAAWVSIWLPALLDGRQRAQLRVAPISHAGELLGLLVVERPADGDSFTEEDERVLTELARQAGLALYNVRLDAALQTTLDELRRQAGELRESRARIVATADAERRRLERDLHDGAQQHLVALAVNLRLATDIIAEDPASGMEMLDQMVEDVQATIREVRELAHGIYPPLLAGGGLAEALRAAANRAAIPVTLTAEGVGRYSQDIETAVYFCCLEALQNVGKHAPEATAQVRLWEESGGLLFSVSDNGPGFDVARAHAGHGFMNMSDRLGAIGGTVRWESQPGQGTTVTGSVPVT